MIEVVENILVHTSHPYLRRTIIALPNTSVEGPLTLKLTAKWDGPECWDRIPWDAPLDQTARGRPNDHQHVMANCSTWYISIKPLGGLWQHFKRNLPWDSPIARDGNVERDLLITGNLTLY